MTKQHPLETHDISFAYEDAESRVETLRSLSFQAGRGEFVCVLGPSGCGKTTLLRVLGGLLRPSAGSVLLEGEPLTGPSRRIGIIFQQSTLFPWLTVSGNIEFALKNRVWRSTERRKLRDDFVRSVGLEPFAKTRPKGLSGGMTQRASLARALAAKPEILLMDEPFGSLDALSRLDMHRVLIEVWEKLKMSVVFVTHDVDEAVTLGDRVVILTHRPATLAGEVHVTLPRPRVQDGIRCTGFEHMRNAVATLARELFANPKESETSTD